MCRHVIRWAGTDGFAAAIRMQLFAELGMAPVTPAVAPKPMPQHLPIQMDGLLIGTVSAAIAPQFVERLRALKVMLPHFCFLLPAFGLVLGGEGLQPGGGPNTCFNTDREAVSLSCRPRGSPPPTTQLPAPAKSCPLRLYPSSCRLSCLLSSAFQSVPVTPLVARDAKDRVVSPLPTWPQGLENLVPPGMEVAFIPYVRGGLYPGIFMYTSAARMMRPVRQVPSGALELLGTLEQSHMAIRCARPQTFVPSHVGVTCAQQSCAWGQTPYRQGSNLGTFFLRLPCSRGHLHPRHQAAWALPRMQVLLSASQPTP